jgi:hypothetical protein
MYQKAGGTDKQGAICAKRPEATCDSDRICEKFEGTETEVSCPDVCKLTCGEHELKKSCEDYGDGNPCINPENRVGNCITTDKYRGHKECCVKQPYCGDGECNTENNIESEYSCPDDCPRVDREKCNAPLGDRQWDYLCTPEQLCSCYSVSEVRTIIQTSSGSITVANFPYEGTCSKSATLDIPGLPSREYYPKCVDYTKILRMR